MKTRRQKKKTAQDLINRVTHEIELKHVTRKQMMEEVKMMSFKVRPVTGDVFSLGDEKSNFLEAIWRIGKIEQILSHDFEGLDEGEREKVLEYLDDMEAVHEMRRTDALYPLHSTDENEARIVTLEIIKDSDLTKKQRLN